MNCKLHIRPHMVGSTFDQRTTPSHKNKSLRSLDENTLHSLILKHTPTSPSCQPFLNTDLEASLPHRVHTGVLSNVPSQEPSFEAMVDEKRDAAHMMHSVSPCDSVGGTSLHISTLNITRSHTIISGHEDPPSLHLIIHF